MRHQAGRRGQSESKRISIGIRCVDVACRCRNAPPLSGPVCQRRFGIKDSYLVNCGRQIDDRRCRHHIDQIRRQFRLRDCDSQRCRQRREREQIVGVGSRPLKVGIDGDFAIRSEQRIVDYHCARGTFLGRQGDGEPVLPSEHKPLCGLVRLGGHLAAPVDVNFLAEVEWYFLAAPDAFDINMHGLPENWISVLPLRPFLTAAIGGGRFFHKQQISPVKRLYDFQNDFPNFPRLWGIYVNLFFDQNTEPFITSRREGQDPEHSCGGLQPFPSIGRLCPRLATAVVCGCFHPPSDERGGPHACVD